VEIRVAAELIAVLIQIVSKVLLSAIELSLSECFISDVLFSLKLLETFAGKADGGTEDFTMVVRCFLLENETPVLSGLVGGSNALEDAGFKFVTKFCAVLDSKEEESLALCRDCDPRQRYKRVCAKTGGMHTQDLLEYPSNLQQ
jgi:hypothetical protein